MKEDEWEKSGASDLRNSRQTKDVLRGVPSHRPLFNDYIRAY